MTHPIPLSLYIHMPWCTRKCPYCDFNAHPLHAPIPEQLYIKNLLEDFKQMIPCMQQRTFSSIFIGGGTPSLLSSSAYHDLLTAIDQITPLHNIEITMEANPGTLGPHAIAGYQSAGINRFSIGIQSFSDQALTRLGRIHNRQQAILAIEQLQQANIRSYNIDLMYGLPQQTTEEALADITTALYYGPPHLSWYQLTIEPNTYFAYHTPALPNDDAMDEIETLGQAQLATHYQPYEISAFAQPNHRCHHNLNYWEFGDYIGIGAGAHSKITFLPSQMIHRYWKMKHPKSYLDPNLPYTQNFCGLDRAHRIFEFMMNALRLYQLIPYTLFTQRTWLEPKLLWPYFEQIPPELWYYNEQYFGTTTLGKHWLNQILTYFLPPK